MTCHEKTHVKYQDMEADVDAAIGPLIYELWRAGLYPSESCQGTESEGIWIEFSDLGDVNTFLLLVAEYEEGNDSLYWRITRGWEDSHEGGWRFTPNFWECPFNENEDARDGPPACIFVISISIPRTDLPAVAARLKEQNDWAARHRKENRGCVEERRKYETTITY